MTKKIDGIKPPVTGAEGVKRSEGVQGASLGGVEKVQGVDRGKAASRRTTRLMSAEERAQLFEMIREEADKMFSKSNVPESKREAIEGAVRMTVEGMPTDDDE